jgi:hypothetical protein
VASVELLFWDGCPSYPVALSQLREALAETGHADLPVQTIRITSEEQADREGFIGSPTIRVDGTDVMPPPKDEPTGLNCRVYRLRDGRFSPTPDPDDLRDGLGALL